MPISLAYFTVRTPCQQFSLNTRSSCSPPVSLRVNTLKVFYSAAVPCRLFPSAISVDFPCPRTFKVRVHDKESVLKDDAPEEEEEEKGHRGNDGQQLTCVMKFGGSSVASAERMREVADLILSFPEERPVIVLSAMGKTTNNLLLVCFPYYCLLFSFIFCTWLHITTRGFANIVWLNLSLEICEEWWKLSIFRNIIQWVKWCKHTSLVDTLVNCFDQYRIPIMCRQERRLWVVVYQMYQKLKSSPL